MQILQLDASDQSTTDRKLISALSLGPLWTLYRYCLCLPHCTSPRHLCCPPLGIAAGVVRQGSVSATSASTFSDSSKPMLPADGATIAIYCGSGSMNGLKVYLGRHMKSTYLVVAVVALTACATPPVEEEFQFSSGGVATMYKDGTARYQGPNLSAFSKWTKLETGEYKVTWPNSSRETRCYPSGREC